MLVSKSTLFSSSEYSAFWRCIKAGAAYIVTQVIKVSSMLPCEIHAIIVSSRVQMLVLASFFPMTEEENATVLIVCACDCDICVVCVSVCVCVCVGVFLAFVWCECVHMHDVSAYACIVCMCVLCVCVFSFCVV